MQYSLRPCKLKTIVDKVGDYFRWFIIEKSYKLPGEKIEKYLNDDLKKSSCIDGWQQKSSSKKICYKRASELVHFLENDTNEIIEGSDL